MLTFTNTPVSKIQLVAALEAHQAADHIIQGTYWSDGKGCAVGCSLHDFHETPGDHGAYETLFGIPRILARLEDGIFEGLSIEDAKLWPLRFARAVPEGKDLSLVWPKFAAWLLADAESGVIKFAKTDRSRAAIQAVADAYSRVAAGGELKAEDWLSMRRAAAAASASAAAYAYAAYAAADDAAAAYAAYAASAAAYAADAYAYAAADARSKARKAQADKLIELLETA